MYKTVDISAETWHNSVIKVHQNDEVNKTLLLLLCISVFLKVQNRQIKINQRQ